MSTQILQGGYRAVSTQAGKDRVGGSQTVMGNFTGIGAWASGKTSAASDAQRGTDVG